MPIAVYKCPSEVRFSAYPHHRVYFGLVGGKTVRAASWRGAVYTDGMFGLNLKRQVANIRDGTSQTLKVGPRGMTVIRSPHSAAILPTLLLAAIVPLAGLGCGGGRPSLARVEGEVTVQGKPLAMGRIIFYPSQGRLATGPLELDGSFRLTTFDLGDGALLGEHVVTVTAMQVSGTEPRSFEEELRGQGTTLGDVRWLTDQKYAERETSPLRATVERGTNRFRFNLDPPPR